MKIEISIKMSKWVWIYLYTLAQLSRTFILFNFCVLFWSHTVRAGVDSQVHFYTVLSRWAVWLWGARCHRWGFLKGHCKQDGNGEQQCHCHMEVTHLSAFFAGNLPNKKFFRWKFITLRDLWENERSNVAHQYHMGSYNLVKYLLVTVADK